MWNSIKEAKNGIDFIKSFNTDDFKVKIAAELKDFKPENILEKKEIKRLDRFCVYSIYAADEAMKMSGLTDDNINKKRLGTIVSSGIGGLDTLQEQIIKMHEKGSSRVSPLFIPMAITNMSSGIVAIKHNAKGANMCIVTACATATHSIGEAFRYIKHGYLDACIAGGTEAPINEVGISGFTSITALTHSSDINNASIPFDKNRDGFVMGEGAGVLVLEELEHALNRNANIIGEIVGYGATCDAYHMTSPIPTGEGAIDAMVLAIEEAGINKTDIGYINAHGTSTPANDITETNAIKSLFEGHAYKLAVSSTKSMTGHLLGAAGAVESIITIKALQEGFLPPTINTKNLDEGCDLDYVLGVGRKEEIKYALSNSLGFGGHNAVLCFKKWGGK